MRLLVSVLVGLLSVLPASAQTVFPDRIILPTGETLPRFTTLPLVLSVPAGQTVTLPASSTWDAIEVAGTLRFARTTDTVVSTTHLTILPGGTLDMGTAADPVLANAWIVFRDVPIDTARDPWQLGNGLVNLGRQTRVGRFVTPKAVLSQDVLAGQSTLTLPVPADWRVGDELLIPDTRQPSSTLPIRREPRLFIAARTATTVTLSSTLTFEHRAIREPDGTVVLRPRVFNLTRNVVLMSENSAGVLGHTIDTGQFASWDVRSNLLIGLGRTTNANLNNAVTSGGVTTPGTNQVGRYASHEHLVKGPGVFADNVLLGVRRSKWRTPSTARTTHGSRTTSRSTSPGPAS